MSVKLKGLDNVGGATYDESGMKKLLVSLFLFLVLFLNVAPFSPSFAQSPSPASNPFTSDNETWYTQSFPTWFTKVFDDSNPTEIFGERYTAAQVQWVVFSLASLPLMGLGDIARCAFTQDVALCTDATKDLITKIPDTKHYANTPRNSLSGIGYVQNLVNKFNPTPSVYAQDEGFGYRQFDVIQSLWRASRNFAFGLVVIIALYYSFMIMFRQKISPQAVISIETAIPKLVISTLLVTFSFAIAGFMVDLMYVAGGIVAFIITGNFLGSGIVFWNFFLGTTGGFGIMLYMYIYFILFFWAGFFSFIQLAASSLLTGSGIFSVVLAIIGIFVLIGIIIVLLINLFKILFMMIKTVANIYIAIFTAPLQLVFSGVFPAAGLGAWLKNLIANLAVFPLMLLFLLLALYFLIISLKATVFGPLATVFNPVLNSIASIFGFGDFPTFGADWSPPFLGDGWNGFIFMGISFGLISALPKAADMAKSLIMKGTADFESGIGQAVGTLGKGVSAGLTIGKGARQAFTDIKDISTFVATAKQLGLKKAVKGKGATSGIPAQDSDIL